MTAKGRGGKNLLLKAGNFPAFAAKVIFQQLIYTAVTKGIAGNALTVTYLDSSAGGLAVTESTGAISVDFGGDTPSADDIAAAILATPAVAALVTVKCFGNGSTVQVIESVKSLAGGSDALLTFATLGGLRSKSLTINNEAIDITSHDSDQFKEILGEGGIRSFATTGSGVFTSAANLALMQNACIAGTLIEMKLIDDLAGTQFHGIFKVTSFEYAGEYNAEQTYTVSLESSGEVVPSAV